MILTKIDHLQKYLGHRSDFKKIISFLNQKGLEQLADGRYELNQKDLFALVIHARGLGPKKARLEHHRSYIDIQFVVKGKETIGYKDISDCQSPDGKFNKVKDLGFFKDQPETWLQLKPGFLAIFYPEDAHAPLAQQESVHKIVVKVPLD